MNNSDVSKYVGQDQIFKTFHNISDNEWLDVLIDSVENSMINGVCLPKFPNVQTQKEWVGSANEQTLREAYQFYKEIKKYTNSQGINIDENTYILDYGCGWGRHYRFFLKDLPEKNIIGIDSYPKIIEMCKKTIPMGSFKKINVWPPTDLPTDYFNIIYAYSVFSHLSEYIGLAWIEEFSRLLKTRGLLIVTTHSSSLFEFCESLRRNPKSQTTPWLQNLAKNAFLNLKDAKKDYEKGNFLYSSIGTGGEYFLSDIYGVAVLSKRYVERYWTKDFSLVDFVDDPLRLPQALIVLQKKSL